jgi:hypothetical protein
MLMVCQFEFVYGVVPRAVKRKKKQICHKSACGIQGQTEQINIFTWYDFQLPFPTHELQYPRPWAKGHRVHLRIVRTSFA